MHAGGVWGRPLGVYRRFAIVGAPKRPSSRRRRRRINSNKKMMAKIRMMGMSAMTTLTIWRRMKRLMIGRMRIRMRLKRMRKIGLMVIRMRVISVRKAHHELTYIKSMLNPV